MSEEERADTNKSDKKPEDASKEEKGEETPEKEAGEESKEKSGEEPLKEETVKEGVKTGWAFTPKLSLFIILFSTILLFFEIHYLNSRHQKRWDLTKNKQYSLSNKTKKFVSSLDLPVQFILLIPKSHSLYQYVRDLLDEYKRLNEKINIEHIDIARDPTKIAELKKLHKRLGRSTALIVIAGHRKRYLTELDLHQGGYRGDNFFKGEESITSSLINLSQEKKIVLCFTKGHGESSIVSRAPKGLWWAASVLGANNFVVREVAISEKGVPKDCDILIVVNPNQPFSREEEDRILSFLKGGGKLFLLLEPEVKPGLRRVLGKEVLHFTAKGNCLRST